MRYGILSDVHGNIEALRVVLDYLQGQQIDRYAFLGDAVGYGANPNEVCDSLRDAVDIAIVGNHDAVVTQRMDAADYYEAARHSLRWCAERLSAENLAWLADLPYTHHEEGLTFSHGAPVAPELFDYLFAPEQVEDLVDAGESLAPVTFIGHSHLTISFRIDGDEVTPLIEDEIVCDPNSKYIITVGSVGQPRDRDPRTCCGIFDSASGVFSYHRLEYDRSVTRQKIIDAGLSPVFGERLLVGM